MEIKLIWACVVTDSKLGFGPNLERYRAVRVQNNLFFAREPRKEKLEQKKTEEGFFVKKPLDT